MAFIFGHTRAKADGVFTSNTNHPPGFKARRTRRNVRSRSLRRGRWFKESKKQVTRSTGRFTRNVLMSPRQASM
jgi:hypothetical protein